MKQLELRAHFGDDEFSFSYGLRWAKETGRISRSDWAKVAAAKFEVEKKVAQELADFAIKARDILHAAYVACEDVLTADQIEGLGYVTTENDIAGRLMEVVKTENGVEAGRRKLPLKRSL